jgi:transposase
VPGARAAEFTMTAPLSRDLRERIVRAVESGSSIRPAARRFAVSASAAIKLMQRGRRTGSTAPAKIGGSRRPLLEAHVLEAHVLEAHVLEAHADALRAIVSRQAGITLREIKATLEARGIVVKALSTIADMLHRLDLSHKKEPESGRAGSARRGPAPEPLAGGAALHGC